MPKVYDDALKKLFHANAQDFVSLVQDDLHVEELLPTELDAEHIYADGLVRCRDEQGQPQLAHFEYQREKDDRMGERLLEYSLKASRMNDYLPVLSCVIYLKKENSAPKSPFIKKLLNGTPTTFFYYATIDLGELTVEEFLAKVEGRSTLLPLLPLTNNGNRPQAVDIMIEKLVAANRTDLLWVGYVLAAKVFNQESLSWLKGRFAQMHDFLWDSPVYQEIISEAEARGVARGVETGKLQALSSTRQNLAKELRETVNKRFPELASLATKCIEAVKDTNTLIHLLGKVGSAQTLLDAQTALEESLLKPTE